MLRQRAREITAMVVTCDATVVAAAFVVGLAIRAYLLPRWLEHLGTIDPSNLYFLPLVVIPTTIMLMWRRGLYGSFRTRSYSDIARELARVFGAQGLIGGALIFLFQMKGTSRALFALFLAIAFVGLLTEKILIRYFQRRVRSKGLNCRYLIVVGQGSRVREVLRDLDASPELGYRVLGVVSNQPGEVPADERYLGRVPDLPALVERNVVDAVLFALPASELQGLESIIQAVEEMGTRIHLRVDFLPTLLSRMALEAVGSLPILTLTSTPRGLLDLAIKRTLDVAVSAIALVLLSPLFAFCALAIKLDSDGPVLFRQRRVGVSGREFNLFKFRSMLTGLARAQTEHLVHNELSGPVFKMKHDPRVTRVGRWLRKFSLDELPQLWNVLRGDMSLVGPRPPLPSEVARYERWQRRRLSVRPGMTCLWQVKGRCAVDFDHWMEMDMYYIDHWSIGLDLRILLQTVPAVLRARGAH